MVSSIFSQIWQRAWACLALRCVTSSRSQRSYAGHLWQPSACRGQRSWLSQIFSQPHPDILRTTVHPFLISQGFPFLSYALWELPTILWGSASCHDFGLVRSSLPYLGSMSCLPTHTSLLPLPWLTPTQPSVLSFRAGYP